MALKPHTYDQLDEIESEFRQTLVALGRQYQLTRAETLDIYTRVLSDRLRLMAKYMLREERGEGE